MRLFKQKRSLITVSPPGNLREHYFPKFPVIFCSTLFYVMKFTKSFSTPDPIPSKGIERAKQIMNSGHLFRYNPLNIPENIVPNKNSNRDTLHSEVSLFEKEFCEYTGHKYAVAVNSCGSAMFLALKAAGIKNGDKVFSNAFTFTAVPSSIVHAGGEALFLDCNSDYTLDIDGFIKKIADNPDVRYLLLSYMRGHISDVEQIKAICEENNIVLIEDCAHSLGVTWQNEDDPEPIHIGHHGVAACFSAQSNKLINAGEGGILVTNSEEIAAYSTLAAGSYELLYQQHIARPDDEIFEEIKLDVPNFSLRMNNLTAAVLRPQIPELREKIQAYAKLYEGLEDKFNNIDHLETPDILPEVQRVGDSFQFNVTGLTESQVEEFRNRARERGIELQVFGHSDNARYFRNWKYSFHKTPDLKQTEDIITAACDFRIPLTFTTDDIQTIADIIRELLSEFH